MMEAFNNRPHTTSFSIALGNYICKKEIATTPLCISALAVSTIIRFTKDPVKVMQWVRGKEQNIQRTVGKHPI